MTAKIVWILGAGFSRPLGGPLLKDLLQLDCFAALEASYPKGDYPKLHSPHCQAVHALYHAGSTDSDDSKNGRIVHGLGRQRIWSNPEEFLDYLDTAALPQTDGNGKSPSCARLFPLVT